MKKVLSASLLLVAITSTLIINGCKKEGPQGPPGSVNIASHTFTASAWNNNGSVWYYNMSVAELTSTNIDSAAVLVYFKTGTTWYALPYTEVASTNYFMNFNTVANNVQVVWIYNGLGLGDDPNTYYSATVKYKVVVIPPSARKANPKVDFTNYNEVKNIFHLND